MAPSNARSCRPIHRRKRIKKAYKAALAAYIKELSRQQEILYATDRYAVLLIFQAMDAAGKDGTIRAMMSGVNPVGCQVLNFKQPSREGLDHDFLWRTARARTHWCL